MAKKLIVGNWKMNLTVGQASLLLNKLEQAIEAHRDVEVVLCPAFVALQPLSLQVNRRKFKLGAQNCYQQDQGAFTGEVSAMMLRNLADYVLVGHSERRRYQLETDKQIALKVQAALRNNLQPILCVGETHEERVNGETVPTLHGQVSAGLSEMSADEVDNLVIAYEPVWAIGTGTAASVEDAVVAIRVIRKQVKALFGAKAAESVRVLYGGSVNGNDAGSFMVAEGIDGLLIGGDSLSATDFARIVQTTHELVAESKL
ncbi:MAG TPA: triose-phosphate isomerase [Candidatus Acidoferrum sp.]|nr:triose-phosphate isomerase [Candidatus Acidoferrum sp.]